MLLSGHVKEIALGALALVSLFMVSMMVRRSGPAAATIDGVTGEPASPVAQPPRWPREQDRQAR